MTNPNPNPEKQSAPRPAGRAGGRPNPARQMLQQLGELYPVIKQAQPLAIGINKQLAEKHPDFEAKTLRAALFHHTRSFGYLKAMAKAEQRFGLDGEPAGEVTAEQREYAAGQLKEIQAKRAEVRKAEERKKVEAVQEARRTQKLEALVEKFGRR